MAITFKYRYRCTTEDTDIHENIDSESTKPSVCKNDSGHTVTWSTLCIHEEEEV